jgi:Subtilase family/LysM domain
MNCRAPRLGALLATLSLLLCGQLGAEPLHYTFVWAPRITDVGAPGSVDYEALRAILNLMHTTKYTVQAGDNFDYIVRKTFLVSQQYQHAYGLYVSRITRLNPGLSQDRLTPGQILHLPRGPLYSGSQLTNEPLPHEVVNNAFRVLTSASYRGARPKDTDKIHAFSSRMLRAFVSPLGDAPPEQVLAEIVNRGLVPAIDPTNHPAEAQTQVQAYSITIATPGDQTNFESLNANSPQALLPDMLPMSTTVPVPCPAQQSCKTCADALQIPNGTDLSNARILVEDTGIQAGIAPPQNVLPQGSGGDGTDLASDFHGTYVYSQIAAPASPAEAQTLHGILPKTSVYALRVVQPANGGYLYSMTDIVNGWRTFATTISTDPKRPKSLTWVVNISASGLSPQNNALQNPEDVWQREHLLIVAAAGNDKNSNDPTYTPFGVYSNGYNPLLVVGALGADGNYASYTNFDSQHVQLFAQGDCMCGAPGYLNGTSQAAPVVALAAAVLASARPTLVPMDVMWRLIATAKHSPGLKPNGVFGGEVSLPDALDRTILVKVGTSDATAQLHRATSITFSTRWANDTLAASLNGKWVELLRLYSPAPGPNPGETCLTAIQYGHINQQRLCTGSQETLTVTEGGTMLPPIPINQVQDIMLPLGVDRDPQRPWPAVHPLSTN